MAVTMSDRLLTVGRDRDREGLMPAIAGRDRDRQGSNSGTLVDETNITPREVVKGGSLGQGTAVDGEFDLDLIIITEDITLKQIMPDSNSEPDFSYWLNQLKRYLHATLASACRILTVTKHAVIFDYFGKTQGTGAIKVDMLISPLTGAMSSLSSLTGAMSSLYSLTGALFSLYSLTGAMSSLSSLTGAMSSLYSLTGAMSSLSSLTGAMSSLYSLTGALFSLSNLTGALSSLSSLTVCPSYYSSSSPHHSPQGVPSVPSSLHQGVKTKLKTITDALPLTCR
ncbi:hypothetical protein EMCRGX_G003277 [Ephydatia muelleri]